VTSDSRDFSLPCRAANDFTVSHETNSLPGNKMYVVRLKKFSLQKVNGILLQEASPRWSNIISAVSKLRKTRIIGVWKLGEISDALAIYQGKLSTDVAAGVAISREEIIASRSFATST
jgi:hypothetical protein